MEEYSLGIQYDTREGRKVADDLSKFPNNLNQNNTHKSTSTTKNVFIEYYIKGLPEVTVRVTFKRIY